MFAIVSRMRRIQLIVLALLTGSVVHTEPITVRYPEGLVHGFLVLRSLDGTTLANGDLLQTNSGSRVMSQLKFRFKDGSVHEETASYTQRGQFRLVNYRLIQKGGTFPRSIDMSFDTAKGNVVVRHTKEGEERVESEQLELPDDLANGFILT